MKRILFLIFALFTVFGYIFISARNAEEHSKVKQEALEPIEYGSTEIINNELDCSEIKREMNLKARKLLTSSLVRGEELLDDGYSTDEITLLIEKLRNDNWATDWRVQELKKSSQSHIDNMTIRKQVESLIGTILPNKIGLEHIYPNQAFEDIATLPEKEAIDILVETPPSAEDLAALIKRQSISEQRLILILNYIESPNDIIGATNDEFMNLIDYTIWYSQSNLLEKLLDLGVKPVDDWYLINSLEWALLKLSNDFSLNKNVDKSAKIVKTLLALGETARINNDEDGSITGTLNRYRAFQFSPEKQAILLDQFNLELQSIQPKITLNKANILEEAMDKVEIQLQGDIIEVMPLRINAYYQENCSTW